MGKFFKGFCCAIGLILVVNGLMTAFGGFTLHNTGVIFTGAVLWILGAALLAWATRKN